MLFDGVKGKGSYAAVRQTPSEKGKTITNKNGPSAMIEKFRFATRQEGYQGNFKPFTRGEAAQADA